MRHPSSRFLGLDHLYRIKGDQLAFYEDMRQRHGDRVRLRLGPYRSWLLFHPADIETVLVSKASSLVRFRKLTKVLAQWNGDSLIVAEGPRWRDRRRKVQPAFQTKRLRDYARIASEQAQNFCDRLDRHQDRGLAEFETDAAMARLTLDIATGTLFGAPPLPNGDDVEKAIKCLSETAFREASSPLVLPDWLPLRAKSQKRWAMALMDEVVTGLVKSRMMDASADHGDLLSMLIEQHEGDSLAVRDDVMSLLIAGHETSGALLSWLFLALVSRPDWRNKICEEINSAIGERAVGIDDVTKLPFLRAVISEVLRLWPPAYSLFLRQSTEEFSLGDALIEVGDLIQIVPYTIHRDPRWFHDPERFEPERFLRPPTWPPHSYLPFGTGPRICIGQNFALVEAVIVAATILRRWQPVSVNRVPEPEPKFSLRPRGGLPMRWTSSSLSRE